MTIRRRDRMSAREDRPLRVLHVFHELRRSGAETMMDVARDLWIEQRIDCELLAVGADRGDFAPDLERRGYAIHHLRPTRAALVTGFVALVRRRRPDVVHIHTERASFWLALAARSLGAGVVQSVHTMFRFTGTLRMERRLQRRIARALGVRFVAVSPDVASHERDHFGNRAEVIRNWVDLGRFAPPSPAERLATRNSLGLTDEDFVVLTVGNCWPMKNHSLVIEAITDPSTPADVVYLHVGDHTVGCGPEERRAADGSARRSAIRFLGTRNDVPDLLHAADVFVMPSSYEGGSVAVIEALATDTPVVLGDAPGLRNFHDLLPELPLVSLEPGALARALAESRLTTTNAITPGRRRAIAAEWFDPVRGVARYARIYRSLAGVRAT